MAALLPVVEPTPTPDAAVAQVRQALFGVLGPDANAPFIEDAAREAIAELWDRPVRVFVAVLAARAVRDQFAPAPARTGPWHTPLGGIALEGVAD